MSSSFYSNDDEITEPRTTMLTLALMCILMALILSGCETLLYYGQAVSGQVKILTHRKPVEQVLDDPETPPTLKTRLRFVLKIREFAENSLHLPVGNHYLSYTDLKRPYVVWNVFAAPEFSLEPKTWRYPIIGRAAYRGYFSKAAAKQYAAKLDEKGFDVYVAGIAAYSTLGWFDDSILNTILKRPKTSLAALIFHELAHQQLYIKNDSVFNESFATAVEQEGLRRWLLVADKNQAYQGYLQQRRRRQQFNDLVMKFRSRLESLYQQNLPSEKTRRLKKRIFNQLKIEYEHMRREWQGYTGYDAWFKAPLNNAKLVSVSTYYAFVPAFTRILGQNDGRLEPFYYACKELARLSKPERNRRLKMLIAPD
ncbi:MAG: aminopeptidase [Desulfobacterales bacterium]|jgi:predicted aminopeptidase